MGGSETRPSMKSTISMEQEGHDRIRENRKRVAIVRHDQTKKNIVPF